jgi:hypothetical protein
MSIYAVLADAVVTVHFCYVAFTIGGELLILLGGLFRWGWVRHVTFRIVHLASVVLVAIEAIGGAQCPLTIWECRLRMMAGQRVEAQIGFIARLVRSVIFFSFPAWVFLAAYVGFALLVGATLFVVAPKWKAKSGEARPGDP